MKPALVIVTPSGVLRGFSFTFLQSLSRKTAQIAEVKGVDSNESTASTAIAVNCVSISNLNTNSEMATLIPTAKWQP
jgi:hypothetical protein